MSALADGLAVAVYLPCYAYVHRKLAGTKASRRRRHPDIPLCSPTVVPEAFFTARSWQVHQTFAENEAGVPSKSLHAPGICQVCVGSKIDSTRFAAGCGLGHDGRGVPPL